MRLAHFGGLLFIDGSLLGTLAAILLYLNGRFLGWWWSEAFSSTTRGRAERARGFGSRGGPPREDAVAEDDCSG